MDLIKIKHLKVGESVKINGTEYKVLKVEKGIRVSELFNEFMLSNKEGEHFFMKLVNNETFKLWKIEIDPKEEKPVFSSKNEIVINTIDC